MTVESPDGLLTLDELAVRVGLSVRNIRYYTSKGLVRPPIRLGRSGYYSRDHVERLELVQDLQAHGFTLAAIERYLDRIPPDATPETIALHRTLVAPWAKDAPERMTHAELETKIGRPLDEDLLQTLKALGIATEEGPDGYAVVTAHLAPGLALAELGLPIEASLETQRIFYEHSRAMVAELGKVLRETIWPQYKSGGVTPAEMMSALESFKPVSIAALVEAYEHAITEARREVAERRTR